MLCAGQGRCLWGRGGDVLRAVRGRALTCCLRAVCLRCGCYARPTTIHTRPHVHRWFLCVFLTNFPAEIAVRVWDCVLCAQEQAPRVLIMIALALMEIYKPRLMKCTDFISAALLLQTAGSSVDDVNDLLTTAFDAVGVGAVAEVSITALRHLARDFVPPAPLAVPTLTESPAADPSLSNPFSPLPWGAVRADCGDTDGGKGRVPSATAAAAAVAPVTTVTQPASGLGVSKPQSRGTPTATDATPKQPSGARASTPGSSAEAAHGPGAAVSSRRRVTMVRGASPRSPATPMSCGSGASVAATPLRHAVLVAAAMAASSPSWVSPEAPTPGRATRRAVRGSAMRRSRERGGHGTPDGIGTPGRTPTRRGSMGSPSVRASPLPAMEVGLFGSPVSWRGDRNSASLCPSPASSRARRRSSVGRLSVSSFGSPASLPSTGLPQQLRPRAMASAGALARRRRSVGPSSRPAVSSRLAPGSATKPHLAAAARARRRRRMSLNTPRASARPRHPQRPAVDLFGGLESPTPSAAGTPPTTAPASATSVRSAGPRLRRSTLMARLVSPTARRGVSRVSRHAPSPLAARARVPTTPSGHDVEPTGWCDASLSPASGHPLTGADDASSVEGGASPGGSAGGVTGRENVAPGACGKLALDGARLKASACADGADTPAGPATALVSTPGRRAGEVIELAMLSPVSRTPRKNSRLLDFVTSPRGYQTGSGARRPGNLTATGTGGDGPAKTPRRSCGRVRVAADVPRSQPRRAGSARRPHSQRRPQAATTAAVDPAADGGAAMTVTASRDRAPARVGVRVALRF